MKTIPDLPMSSVLNRTRRSFVGRLSRVPTCMLQSATAHGVGRLPSKTAHGPSRKLHGDTRRTYRLHGETYHGAGRLLYEILAKRTCRLDTCTRGETAHRIGRLRNVTITKRTRRLRSETDPGTGWPRTCSATLANRTCILHGDTRRTYRLHGETYHGAGRLLY